MYLRRGGGGTDIKWNSPFANQQRYSLFYIISDFDVSSNFERSIENDYDL